MRLNEGVGRVMVETRVRGHSYLSTETSVANTYEDLCDGDTVSFPKSILASFALVTIFFFEKKKKKDLFLRH